MRPFPTKLSITFKGHAARIRGICVDPSGQWLASGSDDLSLKIWEISSGRCLNTFKTEEQIMCLAWNPNKDLSLIAIATGEKVILINPMVGNSDVVDRTIEVVKDSLGKGWLYV